MGLFSSARRPHITASSNSSNRRCAKARPAWTRNSVISRGLRRMTRSKSPMASTACPIAPHPAGVGESHGAVRVEGDRAVEHAQAILELFGQKGDRVAAHGKRGGIVASLRDRQSSKLDPRRFSLSKSTHQSCATRRV